MKSRQPGNKSIELYRKLILLILFSLFLILSAVVLIIYIIGGADPSIWIGKVEQFLLNIYPNILPVPVALLFGYFFFRPIRKVDQDADEERFLEKMKATLLPALENMLVEHINELLIPMTQSTLTSILQDAASIQDIGIIAVKPHINYAELRNRIVQSKERVSLSDTSIFYQFKEFEESFKQTALHKIPLRILLLDPKSPVAKQRLIDLHRERGQLDHVAKLNTASITTPFKKISLENLELRLHSTMPAMQIFICDNKATVGFYFHGQDSLLLPQLEVLIKNEKGEYTPFGRLIEAEFEKKWNIATPTPL
jgi:hypothetical protein